MEKAQIKLHKWYNSATSSVVYNNAEGFAEHEKRNPESIREVYWARKSSGWEEWHTLRPFPAAACAAQH